MDLEEILELRRAEFASSEKKNDDEANNLRQSFDAIAALNTAILDLVREVEQLPAAEAKVKAAQAEVQSLQAKQKEKQEELEALRMRMSGSEKMNVDLNVEYRQAKRKAAEQADAVKAKKREAATANLEQRRVEMNEAQKVLDDRSSKLNQWVGARSSVVQQIEAKTQQIHKENKVDVDEAWRTTFIQLKV
jgi:seryl-tRNA synthetase